MSVIIAVNTMKIITFELWFLVVRCPVDIAVRLQCKIIGYMSCIYGNFSKVYQCKNTAWGKRTNNAVHTHCHFVAMTSSNWTNYIFTFQKPVTFFLVAAMFVSRAALSVGDICKWIYASYQAELFSACFRVVYFILFFSFLLGNPTALQRFQ